MATVQLFEATTMQINFTLQQPTYTGPSNGGTSPDLEVYDQFGRGVGLVGSFTGVGMITDVGTATEAWFSLGGVIPDFHITGLSFAVSATFDVSVFFAGNMPQILSDLLAGADTVLGSSGDDHLMGFGGDDTLIGGLGGDVLEGGTGTNTASYANATSLVLVELESPGYNLGEAVGDSYIQIQNLAGSRFNDVLYANSGVNRLSGGLGNDLLVGKGGADVLDGGAGIDTAGYDASFTQTLRADLLLPSTNTNAAAGDVYISIENLSGSSFNDVLAGDNLVNVISGSGYPNQASGNDLLFGRGGDDMLRGYDGTDRLYGGLGNDRLEGGAGNDVFVFDTALNASTNRDLMTDFANLGGNNDAFWLENAVFTRLGAGVHALNPAFFHAGTAAADANDYIVYDRASGLLSYDFNGNAAGGAIAFAILTNHPVLTASDFLVI